MIEILKVLKVYEVAIITHFYKRGTETWINKWGIISSANEKDIIGDRSIVINKLFYFIILEWKWGYALFMGWPERISL